jgi:hypothetical protein
LIGVFKRAFFAAVGLGAGVALGGYAVRKVERARASLTPSGLKDAAGRRAGGMRETIAAAVEAGKAAAAEREAELRASFGTRPPAA